MDASKGLFVDQRHDEARPFWDGKIALGSSLSVWVKAVLWTVYVRGAKLEQSQVP